MGFTSNRPPAEVLLGRRRLLRLGAAGAAGAVGSLLAGTLAGCGRDTPRQAPGTPTARRPAASPDASAGVDTTTPRVLVAYFSRPGENYYYGGRTWLEVGNTKQVARIIAALLRCDLHPIRAADPYPDSYDATVARNVREQRDDARPALGNALPNIAGYDVVLLGTPIWNVRAPMIMSTFTEGLDLTGRTVHPFTTHAMSGLGTTERDYAETCPGAFIGEGLAVRGEQAQQAGPSAEQWLRRIGLEPV